MNYRKEEIEYLFIGLGAANCLLILELEKEGLLADRRFVIIESNFKNKKDKTFCFWSTEEEVSKIIPANLIDKKWSSVQINGQAKSLCPLGYYHVSSLTLYEKTQEIINKRKGLIIYQTLNVTADYRIIHEEQIYHANYVFDSRPVKVSPANNDQFYINQSFLGWQIQTEIPFFDSDIFTMMDFEIPQNGATQFMYVLPFDSQNALIEITRFGQDLIERDTAEELLRTYLVKIPYKVTLIEQGCIPMTNIPIADERESNVRHTGTRAGHVKPTTGYAFKSMSQDANLIAKQIKVGLRVLPSSPLQKRTDRFAFYDALLLRILTKKPQLGKPIFKRLFESIDIKTILNFLDEKSTFRQETRIFYSLQWKPFLWAAFKEIFKLDGYIFKFFLPLIATIVLLTFNQLGWPIFGDALLIIGFVAIGLPHGALDHVLEYNCLDKIITFKFVLTYILQGSFLLLIWYLSPITALGLFITYSIYHFVQTDYHEWNLETKYSWIWGILFFAGILLGHPDNLSLILVNLSVPELPKIGGYILPSLWIEIAYLSTFSCLILSILNRKLGMLAVSLSILVSFQLSLLQAFGIYFIFHHSYVSWNHLKRHFNVNSLQLWKKGSFFTLGAVSLFCVTMWILGEDWWSYVGAFFIFLSAISFPHIVRMHNFYSYFKKRMQS